MTPGARPGCRWGSQLGTAVHLCLQETKWKGEQGQEHRDDSKLFDHGEDGRRNGVRVILKEDYIGRDDNCDQCVCSTSGVLDGRDEQVLDRSAG